MSSDEAEQTSAPHFTYPILCISKNDDLWAIRSQSELTTCGPVTLANGIRVGVDMVDADGTCWRVLSVKHVGYAPFTMRSLNPFLPALRVIEHEFEPMPRLSLGEVQERVCAALDAHPEYWCEWYNKDKILPERKGQIRSARSIADIHNLLDLDYFGD